MGKYMIRAASAPYSCKCKKGCQTKRCSCFKANLNYTELCKCTNTLLAVLDLGIILYKNPHKQL